ncbi:MUC19 protein, partial [Polyodon spathula]|nr:MUC19 protein [Polyodon spathula]
VCSTFGSGSLRTFSNNFRYLRSTCALVFSQSYETDAQFKIIIQRGKDGILAKIKITIDNIVTVVENGTISVDGARISLPFDHKSVNIHKYGIYTRLRSRREFLSVLWNNQGNDINALWVRCQTLSTLYCRFLLMKHVLWIYPNRCIVGTSLNKHSNEDCEDSDVIPTCEGDLLVCQMTISNYLTSCSGPLTSEYISICQMEFCNGLQDKKHVCPVFEEIARNCYTVTERTYNWRKDCYTPTCPGNQKFKDNGPAFMQTCSNPTYSDEKLISTCVCPEGKILDDRLGQNKCVEKEECTCKFDGQIYKPNSTRSGLCASCTCEGGEWNCQRKTCLLPLGSIEAHFPTTEVSRAAVSPPRVLLCVPRGNPVLNYRLSVPVSLSGDAFFACLFLPLFLHSCLPECFSLGSLAAPNSLSMRDPWLCGNYNDKSDDEFMASSGIVEDSKSFAKSWRRQTQECAEISPICMNTDNEKYGKEKCAFLKDPVFAKCHSLVDYTPFLEKCISSAKCCANPAECMCVALGNYAKACAAKGLIVENWRKDDCDEKCSNNQQFSYNMKACNSTCQSLSGSDFACEVEDVPVDGCGCLEKHLNSKGVCVPETQCPCYYGQTPVSLGQNEIDGHSWKHTFLSQNNGNVCSVLLLCLCFLDCTEGKNYIKCSTYSGPTSGKTCESLNLPVSKIYKKGCYAKCPDNKPYLDENTMQCSALEDCTCLYNQIMQPGETIQNDCNQTW